MATTEGARNHASEPGSSGRQRPSSLIGPARQAELDARILHATLALVADDGYEALKMEKVAAAAGVAKATLYRRWATREDLVADALDTLAVETPAFAADVGGSCLRDDLVTALVASTSCLSPSVHRVVVAVMESARHHLELARVLRQRIVSGQNAAVREAVLRAGQRGELSEAVAERLIHDDLIMAVPLALFFHISVVRERELTRHDVEAVVDEILLPLFDSRGRRT